MSAPMQIDLNCDLGEGCGHDRELMALVTSANICCGFHAGDPRTARIALDLAAQHDVQVGAHPGYPDREHFGRRDMEMAEDEIYDLCLYQVGALEGLTRITGQPLRYLKPHGALYNQACRDDAYARPVIAAAEALGLALMGLPGSRLEALSGGSCTFFSEGFADRRYQADGTLVPRSRPDAFIEDPQAAVRQAQWLIEERGVKTLCVHGDNPHAVAFVQTLRAALIAAGVTIRAFA
jgi:5-oxoprolinase (ATP-hydrolysing) subunit A